MTRLRFRFRSVPPVVQNLLERCERRARVATSIVIVVVGVGTFAGTAWAACWDYTNYLPNPNTGQRFYVKYPNISYDEPVRMSWTYGSHCLQYLRIAGSGTWTQIGVCGQDTDTYCQDDNGNPTPYDCRILIGVNNPITDRFGCNNPANHATVWVHCRATYPL